MMLICNLLTTENKAKTITFKVKNTKKKLKGQSGVVKSSFQQVDIASSLSIIQTGDCSVFALIPFRVKNRIENVSCFFIVKSFNFCL